MNALTKKCHTGQHFILFIYSVEIPACVVECLTYCSCTAITSLPEANGSLLCWFCLVLSVVLFLWKDVSALWLAFPKDAWCHLVYLIITLPALLYNTALSLLRHLKCLAGPFSETIVKLCVKTLQTVPPLSSLQPCVQQPEKRFLYLDDCCSVNGKTFQLTSHSFYLITDLVFCTLKRYLSTFIGHIYNLVPIFITTSVHK